MSPGCKGFNRTKTVVVIAMIAGRTTAPRDVILAGQPSHVTAKRAWPAHRTHACGRARESLGVDAGRAELEPGGLLRLPSGRAGDPRRIGSHHATIHASPFKSPWTCLYYSSQLKAYATTTQSVVGMAPKASFPSPPQRQAQVHPEHRSSRTPLWCRRKTGIAPSR